MRFPKILVLTCRDLSNQEKYWFLQFSNSNFAILSKYALSSSYRRMICSCSNYLEQIMLKMAKLEFENHKNQYFSWLLRSEHVETNIFGNLTTKLTIGLSLFDFKQLLVNSGTIVHCIGHQMIFKGWNYNVNLYQASTDASRKPVMLAIATLLITSVVSGAAWNKSEDVTSDSSFCKLEWIKHIFKCRVNIGDKYWAIRSNRVSRAPNWASQIWLSGYLVQISSPGDCLGG